MDNTLLESSIVLDDVTILCALNLGRIRQIFEVHSGNNALHELLQN